MLQTATKQSNQWKHEEHRAKMKKTTHGKMMTTYENMRKTHANIKKNLWEFKKTHRHMFKTWKETQPEARSQKPQPEPAEARTNTALLG